MKDAELSLKQQCIDKLKKILEYISECENECNAFELAKIYGLFEFYQFKIPQNLPDRLTFKQALLAVTQMQTLLHQALIDLDAKWTGTTQQKRELLAQMEEFEHNIALAMSILKYNITALWYAAKMESFYELYPTFASCKQLHEQLIKYLIQKALKLEKNRFRTEVKVLIPERKEKNANDGETKHRSTI